MAELVVRARGAPAGRGVRPGRQVDFAAGRDLRRLGRRDDRDRRVSGRRRRAKHLEGPRAARRREWNARGTSVSPGRGRSGISDPEIVLDLGNSGTGLRLLLGAIAGQSAFCRARRAMHRSAAAHGPGRPTACGRWGRDRRPRDGELLPLVVRGGGLKG